jgi:uncharacterized protein (DUF2235 family)
LNNRDTVDSVGIIPKRLPFTTSNTIVRTFRHAVSLDERRAKFKANLWNRPSAEEATFGSKAKSASTIRAPSSTSPAAAAGGLALGLTVHQSTPSSNDPDSLHDAKDLLLRKGFSPTETLTADIFTPSLRPSAKKADAKGGDTLNDKSDKDSKTLNSNLNGHTKSQKRRGFRKENSGDRELNAFEEIYAEKNERTTDIDEVWFAVRVIFSFLE